MSGDVISVISSSPIQPSELAVPELSTVFSWAPIATDEEFCPGTMLRQRDTKGRYSYAIILDNEDGLLNCYRPDESFVVDTSYFIFSAAHESWEVYFGERIPDLRETLSLEELTERATIILLKGRSGEYDDRDTAVIEMMLGDPSLDDSPLEPSWRVIARSIWLDPQESQVPAILGLKQP